MIKKSIFAALITLSSFASAEPVYELLEITGGKEQIVQVQNQFFNVIANQNPTFAKHKELVKQWAQESFSWDEMKVGLAEVYKRHYTEDEIEQMVAFYKTPLGKKIIVTLPQVFSESAQVGMMVAQKNQSKLQEMIKAAEAKKPTSE